MEHPDAPPSNSKRIMIADDDADTLKLLEMMLAKEGYRIDTARDGRECLQKLSQNLPDVLILDLMYCEINSLQVARILKIHPDSATIPIIFLSEVADTNAVDDVLFKPWMEFYVTKPFAENYLLDKVQKAIWFKADHQAQA